MERKFLLFFLLLLIACKKDEPVEPTPTPVDEYCERGIFENKIDDLGSANSYLVRIEESDELYKLTFSENSTILVCKSLFQGYSMDAESWTSTLSYQDGTTITLPSSGDVKSEFELNPFGYNQLCALGEVRSKVPCKVQLRIIGLDGRDSDLIQEFDALDTFQQIPIFGLYEDHLNQVEFRYVNQNDLVLDIDTLQIQTTEVTRFDPKIKIIKADHSQMEPGEFHLVSSLSFWNPNIPYMFDTYGRLRWMLDYTGDPIFNGLLYDVGIERLPNGNLYFGNIATSTIYEIDMFGRLVDSWNMQGYIFHHNVQVKPDGNFLVCAENPNSIHVDGLKTAEDYVIEIDRVSKEIVKVWDFKQILDEDRYDMGYFLDQGNVDWLHINAVYYDERDNTIIISGRHQGLVKVDYADNVKWIISPHQGWGKNRQNQECSDFLLTPVDAEGKEYEEAVRLGTINAPDFEWPWYQHAPMLLPNGNLMVFDNGSNRNFGQLQGEYSRAVEYKIDADAKTIEQIWQYGKERGRETQSSIISDVDYLPETGNILVAPGFQVFNGAQNIGGRIIEVDYDTKETYFEAYIGSGSLTFHRVERMPIYPN